MIPNIITKTGDGGETSLWDGARVSKTDPRIACVGELDLFHAALGRARATLAPEQPAEAEILRHFDFFQQRLFSLMGEVATSDEAKEAFALNEKNRPIAQADIERIEAACVWLRDTLNARGCTLKQWAVYGTGGPAEAEFDVARAFCRSGERALWGLREKGFIIRSEMTTFMNRFSDMLFLVGRLVSKDAG